MRSIVLLLDFLIATLVANQVFSSAPNPSTIVDQADVTRIKNSIKLLSPLSSNSLANIYYSVLSQSLVSTQPISDSSNICAHLQKEINTQLENIYYATSTAKLLTNCQVINSRIFSLYPPNTYQFTGQMLSKLLIWDMVLLDFF